jgi:ribose transport system permease protein
MANTISGRAKSPDTGQDTGPDTGQDTGPGGEQAAWHARGFFVSQTAYVSGALLILIVVMAALSPAFLTLGNLVNVATNFSYIAIVSLGATLVILTAGIDLSVGSVMALTAILTALLFRGCSATPLAAVPGLAMLVAVLGGLLAACGIGLINGLLIARLELTPFVTTLGMLSVARGLCYAITRGAGVAITGRDADLFSSLTDGTVMDVPMPLIYLLVLAAGMGVFLHHTATGRYVFALGGNERAARLAGVPVSRVKTGVYVASALLAGFAGILMGGWLGSVPANLAQGYELRIIAAAVIGGANLSGGIGGPSGAVVGAALIEVIRNGLVLARVDTYWQDTLVGLIIIAAVVVDRLRSRRIGA